MSLNTLKYDKINISAKCDQSATFNVDMLYNATYSDRIIKEKKIRFFNFYFNPKPSGDEKTYRDILNRILRKNNHMSEFRIKSLEVNFDYSTELEFIQLSKLAKVITTVLSRKHYKTININADIVAYDYKVDKIEDRYTSYKWFRKKSQNKFIEVKLYRKKEKVNRFEIIFHNVDYRHFKELSDSYISAGNKIQKVFEEIYHDIYEELEVDSALWKDDGIEEFMNNFRLTLDNVQTEKEVA